MGPLLHALSLHHLLSSRYQEQESWSSLSSSCPEELPEEPESILSPELIVNPIQWSLDEDIAAASVSDPARPGCPPNHSYIPRLQWNQLIHSTHISQGTCHPGTNQTLLLLQDCFWCPGMAQDVRRYVGCQECAMAKTPCHLPATKFLPLPIPQHSWSHLRVDFVTDLPSSEGFTCILVAVDRFFRPLNCFPSRVSQLLWKPQKYCLIMSAATSAS